MWFKDNLMTFYLDDREMGSYDFSSKKIIVEGREIGNVEHPDFMATFSAPIFSAVINQKLHADIFYGGKVVAVASIVEDGLRGILEPMGDMRVWRNTEILHEIPINIRVFVICLSSYLAFLIEYKRRNNRNRSSYRRR